MDSGTNATVPGYSNSSYGIQCGFCGLWYTNGTYHQCNQMTPTTPYGNMIQCANCKVWYTSGFVHHCNPIGTYGTTTTPTDAKLDLIVAQLNDIKERVGKIEKILDEEL